MKKRDGFGELLEMLRAGSIDLKGIKIVVFMLGRADIWDNEVMFRLNVQACLTEIEEKFQSTFILVCGLLPSLGDARELVRNLLRCNDVLSSLCVNKFSTREYARPGKKLLCGNEPSKVCFDTQGRISDEGFDILRDALRAKINAAQIMKRQEALRLVNGE